MMIKAKKLGNFLILVSFSGIMEAAELNSFFMIQETLVLI